MVDGNPSLNVAKVYKFWVKIVAERNKKEAGVANF